MSQKDCIDCANIIGKIIIERSDLPRNEKELEKLEADMLAAGIKQLFSARENSLSEMHMNWDWVIRVKGAAEKYALTKVVLLPTLDSCGNIQTLFIMRGGDIKSFCREMNIGGIRTDFTDKDIAEVQQLEKQFGVIIFEKN